MNAPLSAHSPTATSGPCPSPCDTPVLEEKGSVTQSCQSGDNSVASRKNLFCHAAHGAERGIPDLVIKPEPDGCGVAIPLNQIQEHPAQPFGRTRHQNSRRAPPEARIRICTARPWWRSCVSLCCVDRRGGSNLIAPTAFTATATITRSDADPASDAHWTGARQCNRPCPSPRQPHLQGSPPPG